MHFTSVAKDEKGKGKQRNLYKKLHNFIKNGGKNCKSKVIGLGDLGTSHSILQKVCLNFITSWCQKTIQMNENNIVLKYFQKTYQLKPLKGKELESFTSSLQQCLLSAFDTNFNERELENILCKAYRVLNKTSNESNWCDTITPFSLLYKFSDNGTFDVLYPDGSSTNVVGTSITTSFPYGRERIRMEEIVESLNLPKALPAMDKINSFNLGGYIIHPIANFELDFELNEIETSKEKINSAMKLISWFNIHRNKNRK